MDGVLLVNKERGLSSQAVLTKLKHILNEKKIGHCGTLDPMAEGVLVVLLGSATKLSSYLLEKDKEYIAEALLGVETTTYDLEGEVIKKVDNPDVSLDKIDEVLKSYQGTIMQTPPIYSAIKINGRKLYDYAIKGDEVELKPREVIIYEINRLTDVIDDKFSFKVSASKGTYIRSLVHDIGESLKTFATVARLIRTRSGKFMISDAYSLNDIENGNYKLIKMSDAIDLEKITINKDLFKKVSFGGKISLKDIKASQNEVALIYNGELVAIYKREDSFYKAVRVWN